VEEKSSRKKEKEKEKEEETEKEKRRKKEGKKIVPVDRQTAEHFGRLSQQ
jgi:hypothetical protein